MKSKRIELYAIIFMMVTMGILVTVLSASQDTYISKYAAITLLENWTLEGADAKADYIEATLSYNEQEVGRFTASRITELDTLHRDSRVESYVNVLLGMHAELQDSEVFELNDNGEVLHKAYVTMGVSAAEAAKGEQAEVMIWYFGVSDKGTLVYAELLDSELEKEFEEVLKTLRY